MATSRYAVRRDLSGSVEYSTANRVSTVPLFDSMSAELIDVEIKCHAVPEPTLIGANDIRFYLNEHDVTESLLNQISSSLAALPGADLNSEYLRGVENYLMVAEKAAPAFGFDVSAHRKTAQAMTNTGLHTFFNMFCDRTVGWSGILHPALYIYHAIPLPAVSLKDVWDKHRTKAGLPTQELKDIPLRSISFAQGWSPTNPVVGDLGGTRGKLSYFLSFIVENPLRRPIEEIARRLKDLDRQLEDMRVNYLEPTQDAAQKTAIDAKNGLIGVEKKLQDIETAVTQIRP